MAKPIWLPENPTELALLSLEGCTLTELVRGAYIAFYRDPSQQLWLEFAVLNCLADEEEEMFDPDQQIVFYGNGPVGGLRELRHTYWGESGYIFYPDPLVICSAFVELGRYFDL